jgi:hypothetical protein
MADIPCEIICKHPIFVYISVASETGHVAISFLQMDAFGGTIKDSFQFDQSTKFKIYRNNDNKKEQEQEQPRFLGKETLDKNYTTCRIYRENQDVVEKPLQGRATFTKDRLVLFGKWALDVYDVKTLDRMYSFKTGSFYLDNYVDFDYSKCYQVQNWLRKYFRKG